MSISLNNILSIPIFLVYVIISCSGLYLIKLADSWRSFLFISGFFLYGVGAIIWMVILRLMPLSFVFPVASGSLVIGTMFTGVFFLNESLTIRQVFGALLIMMGIAIMSIDR